MSYSISANFLLGIYQGHDKRGHAETYPDLVRFQSALMSAAYSLAAYTEHENRKALGFDEDLSLPGSLSAAVTWLEDNPPSAISLPVATRVESSDVDAYRSKGLIVKGKDREKSREPAVSYTALGGPIVWWWDESPSRDIQEALVLICHEVPYLGEAASLVRVEAQEGGEIPHDAWMRHEGIGLESVGLPVLGIPRGGRAKKLQDLYLKREGQKTPSISVDSFKSNEDENSDLWCGDMIGKAVYQYGLDDDISGGSEPWVFGYILEVEKGNEKACWPPLEDNRLRWSIAMHRAMVSKCGNDVPLILSGKGTKIAGEQLVLPANGVSVQIIDQSLPLGKESLVEDPAFLIMLPQGADPMEAEIVSRAVELLGYIYDAKLGSVNVRKTRLVTLDHFWKAPDEGTSRWWQPIPLYIADNRPPYRNSSKRLAWTLADTVRVSLGYVWRDELNPQGNGARRQLELSNLVANQGVVIAGERLLHPARPENYSYHMNKGSFFTAATAMVNLGNLGSERAAVAIGQTRHLGGGLLVPVDIPCSSFVSQQMSGPKEKEAGDE